MNKIRILGLALATSLLCAAAAAGEGDEKSAAPVPQRLAAVELLPLLDTVARNSGQRFLVDSSLFPEVVVGQFDTRRLDYPLLLSILRNNGMAAVTIHDVVNIVPERRIRQYPLPLVNEDDADVAEDEWVRRIIQLEHASASHFVPIIRPLLPQAGHMAAYPPTNQIIIVDRYGNVRSITGMIRQMDGEPVAAE